MMKLSTLGYGLSTMQLPHAVRSDHDSSAGECRTSVPCDEEFGHRHFGVTVNAAVSKLLV